MFGKYRVWVRGAGEMGSAVAHLLHRVGFSVFLTDLPLPLAIRRPVTFSDAIIDGHTEVEHVEGRYYLPVEISQDFHGLNHIPVLADDPEKIKSLNPHVLVDARLIKHYSEDFRNLAPLVIGLGPGFDTRVNCHKVIETMRGHDLARVIHHGTSQKDTGVPGQVGGETIRRVIRAPKGGSIRWLVNFGDMVEARQTLGYIDDEEPIIAPLKGLVRGMISPEVLVAINMKIGDVDPRGSEVNYLNISEKARAVAAGVFEAIVLELKAIEA